VSECQVNYALGIAHNCAKTPENRALLRSYGFVAAARPYTDIDRNDELFVFRAVIAISHVMEENEASANSIPPRTL
jgi:hypothetical protein